jgi:hypothetical protein
MDKQGLTPLMWAAAHRQVLSSVVFKTVYFKQFSYFNSRFRQVVFYIVFLYLESSIQTVAREPRRSEQRGFRR